MLLYQLKNKFVTLIFFESLLASTNLSVFTSNFSRFFWVVDANKSFKNVIIAIFRQKGDCVFYYSFTIFSLYMLVDVVISRR